jgi:thiol:disulfide interchange protein DsbD
MRVTCVVLVVIGLTLLPVHESGGKSTAGGGHLEWATYDSDSAREAIEAGRPVIVDFYADWCAPCRELDEKTFADPSVRVVLERYVRFKVDQTRASEEAVAVAREFEVRGVPTVIIYQNGTEVHRITGFEPPAQFIERIQ